MNSTSGFLSYNLKNTFQGIDPWSDEMVALWAPFLAYWVSSTIWYCIQKAQIPYFEQYRIHSVGDAEKRNKVSFSRVLLMVFFQQVMQTFVGFMVLTSGDPIQRAIDQQKNLTWWTATLLDIYDSRLSIELAKLIYWIIIPATQFFCAMVIMDAHQYFLHRLFHVNKFLYRHFHSHHHRLYVPYAFGALYNHPVEGFLLDAVGAAMSSEITSMSPRMSAVFFTVSTLKTVDDHCGYAIPWDPLQFLFGNNVQYHDIHHQSFGIKKNFSQPFFTFWDRLLGTEMTLKEVQERQSNKSK